MEAHEIPFTHTATKDPPKTPHTAAKQPAEPPTLSPNQEFRALVAEANSGDATAIEQLRQTLDANPHIWQEIGDLAKHAEQMLIRVIAQGDQLLADSLQAKLTNMKQELLGEDPTTLERLAVERIIACWAQMQYADSAAVTATGVGPQKFWAIEQARTDRRYQAAVKQLLLIRRMAGDDAGLRRMPSNGRGDKPRETAPDAPTIVPFSRSQDEA